MPLKLPKGVTIMEESLTITIISATVSAICFLSFFYFLFGFIVVSKMLLSKKRDFNFLVDYETREKGFQKAWLDIPFEDKRIDSPFGYQLHGKFFECPVPSEKIMLSLHGHNSCSVSQMKYLEMFLDLGFNVFIPDHRRSGESGGECISMGVKESVDLQAWIDCIAVERPNASFYAFGESMGAVTAMLAAARDTRIKAVIEYCGFTNITSLIKSRVKSGFLAKILTPSVLITAKLACGVNLAKADSCVAIKAIDAPVLILHSKEDEIVLFENALKLKECRPDADFHVFESGIHARSMISDREEFVSAVTEFLKKEGII